MVFIVLIGISNNLVRGSSKYKAQPRFWQFLTEIQIKSVLQHTISTSIFEYIRMTNGIRSGAEKFSLKLQ